MIERMRQDLQDTQEEHDEEDLQREFEAKNKKPHWSQRKKKAGRPEQDDGIKERFPEGKVSCASIYNQSYSYCILFSVHYVARALSHQLVQNSADT